MSSSSAHILIEGRVQGVGFRAWLAQEAVGRGLSGWVRNRRTGAVEAAFAGPADVVAAMLEACRRGPPAARVDKVYPIEGTGEPVGCDDFEVRPTL